MYEIADRLLRDVEDGKLDRRAAVARLVAVAAAAFACSAPEAKADRATRSGAATEAPPTFRSVGLNHIALRVTDIPRSSDFYQKHLGLKLLRESAGNCFLGAGGNNFVALFRSETAGMDHYCYTVDHYRADDVVDRLRTAGLAPERHENRVYFRDPDGLEVQLAGEWNDYPRSP